MTPRAKLAIGVGLLLPVLVFGPAEAGIVVFKSGRTIVGRIDPGKDVTVDTVTVHSPEGAAGTIPIERHLIRWFDAAADVPTAAYWELFRMEPIDARWNGHRDAWDASQRPDAIDPVPVPPPPAHPLGLPLSRPRFVLEPPLAWGISDRDQIMVLQGQPGASGYAPRIHVFALETLAGGPDELERLIEEELRGLPGVESFQVDELSLARAVPGGTDQELVTRARVGGRDVRALRRVSIREGWTVVAAGYADASEFERVRPQLQRSLATLQPR